MPALGFGTWRLYEDECTRAVLEALAMGYRFIDTAVRYENEAAVGDALAATSVPRDGLLVSTKLPLECDADAVASIARESLRRLRIDAIDLLLMHWPNQEVPQSETLGAMAQLQHEGLVRWIGVSNFTEAQLEEALKYVPLLTNQVEYHPFLDQRRALAQVERHDLLLTAYSPLARGRVLEDPVLADVAAAHGVKPSQVALRWLVQQPRVVAIPKTGSVERMRENIDIFAFALTADEMAAIDALHDGYRIVNPAFAPVWDEPGADLQSDSSSKETKPHA